MSARTTEAERPGPGVSEALARERGRLIGDLRYELACAIPAERHAPVEGRVVIRFTLAAPHRVVLDFAGPPDAVRRIRVGGVEVPLAVAQGHVVVPSDLTRAGLNEIAAEFTAGDEVLNRRDRLLYTLFVPARAHHAFPCFDQPDLKGRLTLTLDVPSGWEAAANTPVTRQVPIASGRRLEFGPTAPLPTYLFAFVAGELTCTPVTRGARTFRIVHHDSDAADVARHADAVADLHVLALDWLERYTAVPCPFMPLDLVLIPSFQFRGMEHPGVVLYDAARLLLPASPTQAQLFDRASLIAHETAHMWFGNLVTMRWFSDVWLKEVFANLMASTLVAEAFPHLDHAVRFLLTHQPEAYQVDRTAGANPIRQPLGNLRDAGQLYGPIIYQKSVVMMRQLEAAVGPRAFQRAVREYLRRHAFGNADWPELLEIIGTIARRDMTAWGHAWVDEPGRPVLRAETRLDAAGRVKTLHLHMHDPLGRHLHWPQVVRVAVGYPGRVHELTARMSRSRVRVPGAAALDRPAYVLAGGESGYGLFVLDAASREYLLEQVEAVPDSLTRAEAWLALWENVCAGHLDAPAFLRAAVRALSHEPEEQIAERVLGWVVRAYWRLLADDERAAIGPALESLVREAMFGASGASWRAACFHAFRDTARSPAALEWLARIWRREDEVPGLPLDEAGEMALALEIAVRGGPDADRLIRAQVDRTRQPDRRAECTFLMPALSADPQVREAAFARLRQVEHRRREPWALQSLRYLNHPLREAHARRFIRPALDLLPEIQRTGDIFFPARWADAVLWGHRSPEAASLVEELLSQEATWPLRLRWIVLTAAHDLLRAARPS